MVWLLDCWSVHKNKEFLDWMRKYHPTILVIFIPTNCTSELQPLNVVLQQPLKHAFKVDSIHGLHRLSNSRLTMGKNHVLISR
jgi:hypothetical protein